MVKSCRLPLCRAERTELQCAKSAAMTYDRQPISDYFHQADHPTILVSCESRPVRSCDPPIALLLAP
ncbi:DUF4334 domain-containing protein [Pararhizobium sp. LjRoot255]|uniref:DUF4334 domain-containing protein n=1 Tax=Pararhizobium sp. LjRoot255 TaxID=3342298 RepID=UPI003F4FA0C7